MERDTNLCLFNIAIAKAEARLFESFYKNRGSLILQNQAPLTSSLREVLILHKFFVSASTDLNTAAWNLLFTINAV